MTRKTRRRNGRRNPNSPRPLEGARAATVETREALNFRELSVRAAEVNEADRSVGAVFASEAPVPMFDFERWEVIPEVLLMSGMQAPARGQLPFLNSHSRSSIDDQLGSGRQISTQNDELHGRLFFSSTAEDEFTKVREGHVTDVSLGYENQQVRHVPKGRTEKINGRSFAGPVNVVTKWRPREISLVPIGADERATLRGYDPGALRGPKPASPNKSLEPREGLHVDPELRAELITRGMPKTASDAEAQRWLLDDFKRRKDAQAKRRATRQAGDNTNPNPPPLSPEALAKLVGEATQRALTEREERQRAFREEIDEICLLAGVRDGKRFYEHADLKAVRAAILDERAKQTPQVGFAPVLISGDGAQLDKHRGAVGTALVMRCLENAVDPHDKQSAERIERIAPMAQRAAGWEQFRYAGLTDLGVQCLQMDGFDTRGLTREQIAIAALGWPEKVGLRSSNPAYHTTGSFPLITADAINKSMQIGYEQFPATWRGPFRQGTSAQDFKNIHRLRLGAVPNLQDWPDDSDPAQVSLADADEVYAVEAKSAYFGLSYRLMINDDMDVLSRMPAMFGNAASRTVNAGAWAQITGNPTMGDKVALFSAASGARKRPNLTTGALAPSVANLQVLTNLMMQMRGENTPEGAEGADILSLQPKFIIGPSALRTTIQQLVRSVYDPAPNAFMVFNPANELVVVIEPLLDASSTTAWYLAASPTQIDTVEVTFLQGQETPVTRDWVDEKTLSHNWAVLQTFAAKALNHRGLQKANNA